MSRLYTNYLESKELLEYGFDANSSDSKGITENGKEYPQWSFVALINEIQRYIKDNLHLTTVLSFRLQETDEGVSYFVWVDNINREDKALFSSWSTESYIDALVYAVTQIHSKLWDIERIHKEVLKKYVDKNVEIYTSFEQIWDCSFSRLEQEDSNIPKERQKILVTIVSVGDDVFDVWFDSEKAYTVTNPTKEFFTHINGGFIHGKSGSIFYDN